MSEDPKVFHLQDLVPQSLDEIVRANRDKFRLAFATAEEMKSLERDIPSGGPVRHALEGWNVLMMHATAGTTGQPCMPRQSHAVTLNAVAGQILDKQKGVNEILTPLFDPLWG